MHIFRSLTSYCALVAGAACLLVAVGVRSASACDFDDPIRPLGAHVACTFGSLTVEAVNVAGSPIDAREAVEPQMTALLTTGELMASRNGLFVVYADPLFRRSEAIVKAPSEPWGPKSLDRYLALASDL